MKSAEAWVLRASSSVPEKLQVTVIGLWLQAFCKHRASAGMSPRSA
jgi:hypothetical protein